MFFNFLDALYQTTLMAQIATFLRHTCTSYKWHRLPRNELGFGYGDGAELLILS